MEQRALTEFAERQFGVFSREQAFAHGLTRSAISWRLAEREWVRVYSCVYRLAGTPVTWRQLALGAAMLAGRGSALCHRAAAFLFRLDGLCDRAPRPIDVMVPRNRHLSARGIATHHSLTSIPTVWVGALRVTSLSRTLVDLSGVLDPVELEFALDSAQRQFPRIGEWLKRHLEDVPAQGPRGVATLKELLALRTDGATDSALEVKVRRVLRLSGLARPTLRHEVHDQRGYVMRLDFAWPRNQVALHVDGYRWHNQRARFERDAQQRTRLTALGWASVTVTHGSLRDPDWVRALAKLLAERDPQSSLPLPAISRRR